MITDALILLLGGVLAAINSIFGKLNMLLPDSIGNAITYWAGYVNYFNGIFPVTDIFNAFIFIATVWIGMYSVKLAMSIFRMIPIIGKVFDWPQTTFTNEAQIFVDDNGNQHVSSLKKSSTKKRRFL